MKPNSASIINCLNLIDRVKGKIELAILSRFDLPKKALVSQSTQEHFGHYQCNNALSLAKELKSNPRLIAEQLIFAIEDEEKMIAKMEVAGPGFINIFLSPDFLAKELDTIYEDARLGVPLLHEKKRMIVEFSSPNIAKELHVGHLRSTIIGDSLARLFEFLGHDVLRLNHVGDWGTQFGMLIAYLKRFERAFLEEKENADLGKLMHWYKEAKKLFDADPEFKKASQLEVITLQSKEPNALAAWEKICAISRKGFQTIYDLLDVKIFERGESFYNRDLAGVVESLEKKGLVKESDGAKCLFLEDFNIPMIIKKSDGGYNYSTTDMAAMKQRIVEEKAERIIIVTDAGQQLHFQMIAKASELSKVLDSEKVVFNHVPFGVVLGPDGKKFKTRSGSTEPLIALLQEAIDRAYLLLKERMKDLSDEKIHSFAAILGIDAVKYADLSCHRLKDYIFSYDRMLNFEGNTAAYLLYSYVRIQSIKRKVNKPLNEVKEAALFQLTHPSEIALGLALRQFGEALEMMDKDLLPNRLCDYLYSLAEKFHAFFRDCRVEGSDEENSRLLLCEFTGRILKKGLEILGLKTMDRM
ncbi:MAG: arginine--tRNA ligase [Simkaniaceae bacterium]